MTGEGISSKVIGVFPFGGVSIACSGVSEVAMFHLGVIGKSLVHVYLF